MLTWSKGNKVKDAVDHFDSSIGLLDEAGLKDSDLARLPDILLWEVLSKVRVLPQRVRSVAPLLAFHASNQASLWARPWLYLLTVE
jgi:hypothetical protein